jgi:YVTN family beta-propeller protein
LTLVNKITGNITPKSVAVSPKGLIFAQNMMYRHSVTVYDGTGTLVRTIPDSVELHGLGLTSYPAGQVYRGAPVEAAFSPDGSHAYVTNYLMSGPGFTHPGDDVCSPHSSLDTSFVYRIDITRLVVDQAIAVGSVPKFIAVSPDGRWVLVANWCSYDLSVIDATSGLEVKRLHLGPYPRGIAIDAASKIAYVAVMGTRDIATVDLNDFSLGWIHNVGQDPRHIVLSPNGLFLYVTNNGEDTVAKIDIVTSKVVARVHTGDAPRSMTISSDGTALYVVNYFSNTVSKIRADDMVVVQTMSTPVHPIGITYDANTRTVWVACYSGVILLLHEG